jgi:hypothetical protein
MRPDFDGRRRRVYPDDPALLVGPQGHFLFWARGLLSDAAFDDKVRLMGQWRRPYRPPSLATPRP